MKRTKQFISILLTAGMLLTGIPVFAFSPPAEAEEILQNGYSSDSGRYAIYPVPQSEDYLDQGEFELETDVSVVSEEGIDNYTNAFLDEILSDYGRTKTSAKAAGNGSQILLGIKGSGGAADAYADSVALKDAELFTKTDSYLLSAKDGSILILGQDTDAVYHGLATLQMMFSSFNGTKFLNVQIEDYAVMKMRGFIEGFYGGWNYEGRESLMRFAKDVKMNTYIYASKTDPYHTNLWDQKYPDDEIEKIRDLVKIGDETKVKYGWSVHAAHFFSSLPAMSDANYNAKFDENFNKLTAKFQQLYDAGVRKFAILNDDFGGGSHAEVVRMLNKLDDEFLKPNNCENLSYCMQGYNKAWSGNGAELQAMNDLNESIDLFWTGDDVNSPITQETVSFVKERTGHEAVYWLNYPVNEHAKSGIYLGNITHYARDGVTGLAGAVSNPSLYTESNKVGLFQLAALFWNNNDYLEKANFIWEESFKYLQPEVYEAYLTIARNVANCPNSERVPNGFPESEYISGAIDSVSQKLKLGRPILEDENAQKLKLEFENILSSIETFRSGCKNATLVTELDPWLKSLHDVATAGSAALEAVFQIEQKDADAAWSSLSAAGQAMSTQNTYPSKPDNLSIPVALAGSKRLVPFVNKLISSVKKQLLPFLDPNATDETPSFYAVLAGTERADSSESAKIFDGDETTFAAYEQNQQVGDYFGIDLGKTIPVQRIDILQGSNNSDVDYFHNAILEYSEDSENWQELETFAEDAVPQHIIKENLTINARFIRLRLLKTGTANKANYWTRIREFKVNDGFAKEPENAFYASEGVQGEAVVENLTYRVTAGENGSLSLPANAYIGVKLKELSSLKNISVDDGGNSGLTLQYSVNELIWHDVPASSLNGEAARYVRLYNGTDQAVSATLTDFTVTVFGNAINPSVSEYSAEFTNLKEGTWSNLFDGDTSTYIWTNTAQVKDQYIIVDLGSESPVYDFTITQEKGNPKFYNAAFYLSADKSNWGDPVTTVTESGGAVTGPHRTEEGNFIKISRTDLDGIMARYLKIQITGPSGYFLRINEIEFNKTIAAADEPISKIETNSLTGDLDLMIDGNISSAYVSERPSDGTAYIKYPLTENTKLTSAAFLQNAAEITNAEVKAEFYEEDGTITEEVLGTLGAGITSFYFSGEKNVISFTVTWPQNTVPTLYEILPVSGETVHTVSFAGEGAPDSVLYCPEGKNIRLPENAYQKPGYTFEGWNDGTKTYKPNEQFAIGSEDAVLTAVWAEIIIPVSSVTVTPDAASLKAGETKQLNASVSPEDASEKGVIWSSGNESVASVDQNGLVTAKTEGTAVITASAKNDGSIKGTCSITVTKDVPDIPAPKPDDPNKDNPNPGTLPGNPNKEPVIEKNKTYESGNNKFKVTDTSKLTASYAGQKTKNKKISVPDKVTLGGKTYKVTSIDASAFKNNTSITEATIGKNVETIGKNAFTGCKKLKKVTIKSTQLKKIGSKAFNGCKSLKTITINSKKLTKIEKNAFKGIHKNAVFKVPASKYAKYKNLIKKSGWKKMSSVKKK